MRKGIRNLQNRLDREWYKTCHELQDEGYLFTEYHQLYFSSALEERSGKCIVPYGSEYANFAEIADDIDRRGFHFSLRLYDLLGWDVDISSVECYDFKAFADELEQLLYSEDVIMRTWKYKDSVIYPAPIYLWGHRDYGEVYKLDNRKSSFKKLEAVAQKIKDLAISHLTWDMLTEEAQ